MQPIIEFVDVSKQYNLGVTRTSIFKSLTGGVQRLIGIAPSEPDEKQFWALRGVSFELRPGECLGLVGHNGAGKSTILKLLANISRPTSGKIAVTGRLSALIELGSGFHPDLTGRENIFLNGTVLGLKRSEILRRFDEIVAFSEIEKFIDTPVKRYSSGMMVRLGFSVASCIEPEVLLVDEVLAVGDASFRQKCLARIQSLINNGTAIVFVSHNLHMMQALCPTAIYIERGEVQLTGNTADIIDAYERDLQKAKTKEVVVEPTGETESVTSAVRLTLVEVLDEAGVSSAEFHSDRPVEIRVHYDASHDLTEANAVVRIVRSDGLTCCRMRTRIDDAFLTLRQGTGTFSLSLMALQLISASYYVTVSIWTKQELAKVAESRSTWFHVTGCQSNDSEYSGIFEPQRTWFARPDELRLTHPNQERSTISVVVAN